MMNHYNHGHEHTGEGENRASIPGGEPVTISLKPEAFSRVHLKPKKAQHIRANLQQGGARAKQKPKAISLDHQALLGLHDPSHDTQEKERVHHHTPSNLHHIHEIN